MAAPVYNTQALHFDAIRIGLASPEKIREWSHGEVKKPETINYRTLKPEKDGLFCERIFGPTKDWECHCGKYKRVRYKGVVCERCGVEVTVAKVRRERMGHIELASPVSHIWYVKGIPSRMGTLLDIAPRALERILYFAAYVVLDPGTSGFQYKQVLSEKDYRDAKDRLPADDKFRAGMGTEAVKELLCSIDLEKQAKDIKAQMEKINSAPQKSKLVKRLEVIESFLQSGNRPEWMAMDVIPVIPPDLRPMVQLDGGRFATSDLNDLYRRVLNRNNRLARMLEMKAPEIIVRNEKRMLQEAVDALIDNGRRGRPVTGPGNRALKSLSDMLRGKQGRFRQNLLGKRVDYSGRSVIVVGPELKIYQCGLPKEMAIELFKPFVMKKLVEREMAHNVKSAKRMVERLKPEVWDVLEQVINEHPVMLNRAPTLHRLGIQAFEPILVEGRAIKLHPLVCTAFNADFDGDQMAVHVPLSIEAQAECRFMLLSTNNLLKPADGAPVAVPSQDMVLGMYYLTMERPEDIGSGRYFKDANEAIMAYENGELTLHSPIKVRRTVEVGSTGKFVTGLADATVGRIILNEKMPQDLDYVIRDENEPESYLPYEISFLVGKKQLAKILQRCIDKRGITETATILDNVKSLGYKYSTRGSISVSIADIIVPETKWDLIHEREAEVDKINRNFKRGLSSEAERSRDVKTVWAQTTQDLTNMLLPDPKNPDKYSALDQDNNIFIMIDSGARGSKDQLKQLAAMRGLMASPSGETLEFPIKSCFREGLDVQEYFMSAHGTRKSLSDTALRTAESGYLTRRLVDVSQDMIVRVEDCCAGGKPVPGVWVSEFKEGTEIIESLEERCRGRYAVDDIVNPETGELIVPADTMITRAQAQKIEKSGITRVHIRSMLTCRQKLGTCAKCYGADMSNGLKVRIGEAVGIVAAQAIGEPGTQLTMRNFHSGGIATSTDITQGLPRVQELFEARKPREAAVICEVAGTITSIRRDKRKQEIVVEPVNGGESKTYPISYDSTLKVTEGQYVEIGTELTRGSINPHDLLRIMGLDAVRDYLIREVQKVYRLQGVDINDKHVEIIVRQMLKRVRVTDPGDTGLLPGSLVDAIDFEERSADAQAKGGMPAEGDRILLGITKAALATESFLSAASFQETTRVLTEAAIKGKVDPLVGLKENVIIGKLIPAGTGMNLYQRAEAVCLKEEPEEEEADYVSVYSDDQDEDDRERRNWQVSDDE